MSRLAGPLYLSIPNDHANNSADGNQDDNQNGNRNGNSGILTSPQVAPNSIAALRNRTQHRSNSHDLPRVANDGQNNSGQRRHSGIYTV